MNKMILTTKTPATSTTLTSHLSPMLPTPLREGREKQNESEKKKEEKQNE